MIDPIGEPGSVGVPSCPACGTSDPLIVALGYGEVDGQRALGVRCLECDDLVTIDAPGLGGTVVDERPTFLEGVGEETS